MIAEHDPEMFYDYEFPSDNNPEDDFPLAVALLNHTFDFHYYELCYDVEHLLNEATHVRPKFDSI